jgi:hypothetical protein
MREDMWLLVVLLTAFGTVLGCDDNFATVAPDLNARQHVPIEIPDLSYAAHHLGRLILHDFADNGALDASVLYGINQTVRDLIAPPGSYPYLRLEGGRIPLICPGVPKRAIHNTDDTACCGVCSESYELLALFTFLYREHNSVARNAPGTGAQRYAAGRRRTLEILTDACAGCAPETSNATLLAIVMAGLSASKEAFLSEAVGNIDPTTYCSTLTFPGQLGKLGRRLNADILNRDACVSTPPELVGPTGIFEGTDVMVALLGETHGPAENDVTGPVGRWLFEQTIGVGRPEWLYNGAADGFVGKYCPSAADSSSNGDTTTGSLIFFTVMFGVLALAALVNFFVVANR